MSAQQQTESEKLHSEKLHSRCVELDRAAQRLTTLIKAWRESWKRSKQWGKLAAQKKIKEQFDANKELIKETNIELEQLDGDPDNFGDESALFEEEWYRKDLSIKKDWQDIADRMSQRLRENAIDEIEWKRIGKQIEPAVEAHKHHKELHDSGREKRIKNRMELGVEYSELSQEIAEW